MDALTHTLNCGHEAHLDVLYTRQEDADKIKLIGISVKVDELTKLFPLKAIWMNDQPACQLKGFKRQIIQEDAPIDFKWLAGDRLALFSQAFKSFPITISYQDQPHSFQVSSKLRVSGLESMIENQIPSLRGANYTLSDTGSIFLADSTTLGQCNVIEGSCLTLSVYEDLYRLADRQNGRSEPRESGIGVATTSFVNFKTIEPVPIVPDAEVWRRYVEGANLEAMCVNGSCVAYNERVLINLGMGTFAVGEESAKAKCPCCKEYVETVVNCIFIDCLYTIKGREKGAQEQFLLKNQIAPSGRGTSFEEISDLGETQIVEWLYLKIKTEPIPASSFGSNALIYIKDWIGL